MRHPNFLKRAAARFCGVLTISLVLAVSINAYTVVMRGGRRVEIPSQFVVTVSTLTYEVSPGVQVTLALAAIDIPSTEKANNEVAGSFMRRLDSDSSATLTTAKSSPQARRTITNRDLEASMHRRRDSELAYENRRKQLGLPSVEESRQRASLESETIRSELAQRREVEQQSEKYWRERATALRTEMAALDGELTYVRARLDEHPWLDYGSSGWSSLFFGVGSVPFGFGRGAFGNSARFPQHSRRPNIFVAPRNAQLSGRVGFGHGSTRAQVFINPGMIRHAPPFGVGTPFPAHGPFSGFPVFGTSVSAYDTSYERSELITQFNQLGAARAGLNARWRELEDEARRAGVPPGWLRP